MSMILHCGANEIERAQVGEYLPKGAMGPRHNPVPYSDFLDNVTEQLERLGLGIVNEGFGVKPDASQFFGLMELTSRYTDYSLMVGLRASYDQSLARGLCVGSRVFVCDNLAFSGQIEIRTKQTTFIQRRLPGMIAAAVEQIPQLAEAQERRFEAYRNYALPRQKGDACLIGLVRRGVLNPSQVGKAIKEWDEPSHPEHAEQGFSVWRLHNAVTEAIKPANPARAAAPMAMERTPLLTQYLDQVVKLAA